MEDSLKFILIIIPLVAGAIAIFFAFQLMRKYKAAFVNSYFFYLVFLYIFGVYSLIGSGVLEHLFIRMGTDPDTIRSARLFTIMLGIPILVLSKYMILRSMAELFSRRVWAVFSIIYFIVSAAAFILYAVFVVRLTRFGTGDYQLLVSIQRWLFAGLMIFIYTTVFVMSFWLSRSQVQYERSFSRILGSWYILFMVLVCPAFLFSGLHEIIPFIFVAILLSWHLIPILFLNIYLEKYHGQTALVEEDFEGQLLVFAKKFEISKREREVVHLICKGLSNQEISDALYISLQTVKDHIHRIFIKTGVKNRVQLTNLIRAG